MINKITPNKYQELYNIALKIFGKKKNTKVELCPYGVELTINTHNSYEESTFVLTDLGDYDIDDKLDHTCSMNEVTGDGNDYQINELIDFLESSSTSIKLSEANKVALVREAFKVSFDLERYKTNAYIFNVVKDSLDHKVMKGLEGWKKVFEYKGNHGIVCTYMWKKQ